MSPQAPLSSPPPAARPPAARAPETCVHRRFLELALAVAAHPTRRQLREYLALRRRLLR